MLYPVMLELAGLPVLVVGGGTVAARKVAALVQCGAIVTIVAPHVGDEMAAVVASAGTNPDESVTLHRREYRSGDVAGMHFVVVATDDPAVNAQVASDATRAGVFVNAADDPANCTAILPAVLRREPVVVAVSTGGSSPAMASWLRDRIAALVDEGAPHVATTLAEIRRRMHEAGESTESVSWIETIERLWAARHDAGPTRREPAG